MGCRECESRLMLGQSSLQITTVADIETLVRIRLEDVNIVHTQTDLSLLVSALFKRVVDTLRVPFSPTSLSVVRDPSLDGAPANAEAP